MDSRDRGGDHGSSRTAHRSRREDADPTARRFDARGFFYERARLFADFRRVFQREEGRGGRARKRERWGLNFGEWNLLVRELADWNPSRYDEITSWPIREALLSYEQKLRRDAIEEFRFDVMIHTLRGPWVKKPSDNKAPKVPEILRD
jgi:hypothetical protein